MAQFTCEGVTGVGERSVRDRRWWVLATMVAPMLVVVLDNTVLTVALKPIQQSLGATQSQLAWALNAYTLLFAGLLLTGSLVGDRYGHRRVLVVGLAIFGVASALSAFAATPDLLIVGRALMGVGAAAVVPSTLSVIGNVFGPAERGRALAVWAGATGVAVVVGPIAGGVLLTHFWWGSVLAVNVPVVLFSAVAIGRLVPESRHPAPGRLDLLGVVLSIVGLVAVVYGISKGGETREWAGAPVLVPLLGGVAVLAVSGWRQQRSDHPAPDLALFGNPALLAAWAATTLAFFALFGATFYLTFYLQYARGFTPLQAGLTFLPIALALMTFAPRSARLVKEYGAKRVCAGGLLTVALAFGGYLFVDAQTPLLFVLLLLLLLGTGLAHVVAPATESMMATLSRDRVGAGSSVNNTVRQVGGALGVAVLGAVLASSYRSHVEVVVQQVPEPLRGTASESVGGALAVAARLPGAAGVRLADAARDAFVAAMHTTAAVSALVALLGAVIVLRYLPGLAAAGSGLAPPRGDRQPAVPAEGA